MQRLLTVLRTVSILVQNNLVQAARLSKVVLSLYASGVCDLVVRGTRAEHCVEART